MFKVKWKYLNKIGKITVGLLKPVAILTLWIKVVLLLVKSLINFFHCCCSPALFKWIQQVCGAPCTWADASISPADSHRDPRSTVSAAALLMYVHFCKGGGSCQQVMKTERRPCCISGKLGGRRSRVGCRRKCELWLADDILRQFLRHSTWPLTRHQLHSGIFMFRVNIKACRRISETVADHIMLLKTVSVVCFWRVFFVCFIIQVKPSRNKVERVTI